MNKNTPYCWSLRNYKERDLIKCDMLAWFCIPLNIKLSSSTSQNFLFGLSKDNCLDW